MRIVFSKDFEDTPEKLLKITKKDVIRAVTNPIKKQRIDMDGLEILLFLQKERRTDSYLLVIGHCKGNTLEIGHGCFRLLADLVLKAKSEEPIILLQQLANNFGYPMQIGKRTEKFLFRESFIIPVNVKANLFGMIPAKPGDQILWSMFERHRLKKIKGKMMAVVECAIVFILELNSYIDWLNNKTTVQVSSQAYDIFIAYKRTTGKSFAQYLKNCLSEEGYRAFLDKPDIPEEFKVEEKWYAVRDEAIRNSKRFLLIITIAIESAEEVAKELVLARKVPDMKFIYARHDVLEPEIQISFDNEIIDLAEGNQIAFSTDDDLARKILQILKNDERKLR